MVAVVGIGRTARFGRREHQPVTTQQPVEAVASQHPLPAMDAAQHKPQLVASDTRVFPADFEHIIQQKPLTLDLRSNVGLGLVPGLTGMAKQTAREGDLKAAPLNQFRHCLAPDFFLIGMLKYDSALSINKSRASVSNLEKAKAFSSSLMRFFKAAFSSL